MAGIGHGPIVAARGAKRDMSRHVSLRPGERPGSATSDPHGTGTLTAFRALRCAPSAPAGVAQQAEQPPCKRQVSGSIPLTGSTSIPAKCRSDLLESWYLAGSRSRRCILGHGLSRPSGTVRCCTEAARRHERLLDGKRVQGLV